MHIILKNKLCFHASQVSEGVIVMVACSLDESARCII